MNRKPLAALTSASLLLLAMTPTLALADSTSSSVSQTQTNQVSKDGSTPRGAQTSQINGSAAAGATGNIGLNAAGGTSNVQANDLIMQSAGTGNALSPGSSVRQTLTNVGTGSGQVSSSDTSTLGDSAASGSVPAGSPQGNFGANSAAGDSNEQINILTLSAKPVGAASETSSQTIDGNGTTKLAASNYTSSITGTMGEGLTGNGGFNTAAGDKNLQANALDLFTAQGTTAGSATQNLGQTVNGDSVTRNAGSDSSTIGGDAFTLATGNVGANSAAGGSNIQNNTTLVTDKTPLSSVSGSFSQSATNVTSWGLASANATISTGGFGSGNLSENNAAGAHDLQMNILVVGDPTAPAPVSQNITQSLTHNTSAVATAPGTATVVDAAIGIRGNAQLSNSVGMQNTQLNALTAVAGDASTVQQTITQKITGSTASGLANYTGSVTGNTALSASGNVGVTNAAGLQNVQANAAVLITGGADSVTQSFNPTIASEANRISAVSYVQGTLDSHVNGNTAVGASGNVGIDGASGMQNLQANGLVIVRGTSPASASTAGATQQMPDAAHAGAAISGVAYSLSNATIRSTIGGNSGLAAVGRLGISTAAGAQNVQNNEVSLYAGTVNGSTSGQSQTQSTTTFSRSVSPTGGSMALVTDSASIGGNAGAVGGGIIGFNTAAGVQNVQSNTTSVFAPNASGAANTSTQSQQTITGSSGAASVLTTDSSSLTGNAGLGAHGIVGANAAAGAGNQQMNLSTVLSDANVPRSLGANVSPTIQAGQTQNTLRLTTVSDTNTASIDSNVFAVANGVISANDAAGAYNQQANAFLVSTGNLGNISPATAQQNNGASLTASGVPNTSTIGGNAFVQSSGAIGANNTAGLANQQVNNVVVGH